MIGVLIVCPNCHNDRFYGIAKLTCRLCGALRVTNNDSVGGLHTLVPYGGMLPPVWGVTHLPAEEKQQLAEGKGWNK